MSTQQFTVGAAVKPHLFSVITEWQPCAIHTGECELEHGR